MVTAIVVYIGLWRCSVDGFKVKIVIMLRSGRG